MLRPKTRIGEETGEEVTRDNSWDYTAILWNGVQAEAIQAAFEKLTYQEQRLLEERNAVCMTCGRVSPISERKSFEDLAVMFEGSTASGAERTYRKAVEKLTVLLVETSALHAVRLQRKSVKRAKKIAAAVYEYQTDCDGEWGEHVSKLRKRLPPDLFYMNMGIFLYRQRLPGLPNGRHQRSFINASNSLRNSSSSRVDLDSSRFTGSL